MEYGCHPSRSLLLFVPKDLYIEFFCLSHALPPTLRSRWKGVEEVEVEEGSHQGLGSPEPGDGTFLIPGSGRQMEIELTLSLRNTWASCFAIH